MNHDFVVREERRSPKAPRKENAAPLRRRLRFAWLLADRIVIVAIAALATIGVPLNALFLQDGRHPAPLFQSSASPAMVADRAPLPPPRPAVAPAATHAAVTKTDVARSESAPPGGAHTHERTRDAIGMLLVGESPAAMDADKKTLFVQRALAKLGYNVRVDGRFGGSTRQALERFERDSGLPVKGEPTPRILRRLSSRSGVTFE